ncbi:hypothetical protein FQN53_000720 [Emmonsiellopsis sp. PD_33]|nr:hypothetical protein FQN53_000720 [Emmonsiellopsis sp. PD_33]
MATASSSSAFDRRSSVTNAASIRSNLRQSRQPLTGSPHTPQQRQGLPPYTGGSSSPGSSFRHEEDAVIFELGSRYFRAGFEGDSTPVCVTSFGPEEARRVGDYRGWINSNGHEGTDSKKTFKNVDEWTKGHELWSMDIRDFDIGLFEDKIERAIREVYNKYLLTDAGSSRLVIVLPSVVPHPLLSSLLSTIFNRWRYPGVTLLPSAAMAAASAGLRSALVVDIGWAETTVTGLYEYREIHSRRSTRSMKSLMHRMASFLSKMGKETEDETDNDDDTISVNFEWCEEITTRMAWCKGAGQFEHETSLRSTPETEDTDQPPDNHLSNSTISLPSPLGDAAADMEVPFAKFSEPVEQTFFAGGLDPRELDDEEMPLDVLVYLALLALPPDIRGACMSRIIFIGGGSNIPGVRRRILDGVDCLLNQHGWDPVRGKIVKSKTSQLKEIPINQQRPGGSSPATEPKMDEQSEPASNPIDEKLERANKDATPYTQGILRQVESLGPWAGASLVASLKVRGVVEIEREKFLQHGLAGASRDSDLSAIPDRRSGYGPGVGRSGGERSSWTLGEWG